MNRLLLIVILLVSSCASFSSNWSEWREEGVALNKKIWHNCRTRLDGPELNEKGQCYQDLECRYKKRFLLKKKKQCRNKVLFCKWGDISCLRKYNIFFSEIINKGVVR